MPASSCTAPDHAFVIIASDDNVYQIGLPCRMYALRKEEASTYVLSRQARCVLTMLCSRIISVNCWLQYLEARSKGRVVSNPGRDSRQGLDVAYLSALTTAAKLAEEEMRIQTQFVTQTMSLKVHPAGMLGCIPWRGM